MKADQYGPPEPVFEPSLIGGDSHVPLIAPWLQPHERLLGIVDVDLNDLIRHSVPRKLRPGNTRRGALDVLASAVVAVMWVVNIFGAFNDVFIRSVRRIVRGAGLTGGWQSMAGRFVIAVRTGPDTLDTYDNSDALMVFTDRRILLMCTVRVKAAPVPVSGKVPPGTQRRTETRVLGEIQPGELRSVVIRHTWVSNRVDLHFADGSRAAVEASTDQAEALEALSRGIVPPPRP
jgi:hypothetical protein